MKFAIDTEFNGFNGELLSLALVPWGDDTPSLYLRVAEPLGELVPWVAENVWPLIDRHWCESRVHIGPVSTWAGRIADYLETYCIGVPYIIADWPDDIRFFCEAIITAPGEMTAIPRVQFDIVRVDPYEGGGVHIDARRHNAWWDARVLRDHLRKHST